MILEKIEDISQLNFKIEFLRQEMIKTGIEEGFTSERTIQLSQRLDQYIIEYQLLKAKKT